jgi:hypothetical protein
MKSSLQHATLAIYAFSSVLTHTHTESESYVTTDGQSASLSWNKAPIWGLWPDFYYCQTVAGLLIWGALSDERTGLSFTIATGPRQRSHSRDRVSWDSRPYFTVSDSRLLFSSPPTTPRVTVEVFDPSTTRVSPLDLSWLHADRICNTPCNSTLLHSCGCHRNISFVAVWTVFI